MKLIHIFFVAGLLAVAFLSVSAPAALADGTDPFPIPKACGGVGQPRCDAEVLTLGSTVVFPNLSFLAPDLNFNTDTQQCAAGTTIGVNCNPFNTIAASGVVINDTGTTLSTLDVTATGTDSLGNALVFGACTAGGAVFPFCTEIGTNSGNYALSGGSLCSVNSDDVPGGIFTPDGDSDDACGVIIGFVPSSPTENLVGATMSFSAGVPVPEPSSALLLLVGLVAGVVGFKSVRNVMG